MSTVFRIEKNTNYTVMSNCHLKDKRLSLKAKGLFSVILSLPDEWDYTLGGLAAISKESLDAIRTAVNELENIGYLHREQTRDKRGRLSGNEYLVYECPDKNPYMNSNSKNTENADAAKFDEMPKKRGIVPFSPSLENPTTDKLKTDLPSLDNPITDNPITEKPSTENPTTATYYNKSNKNISNKNQSIISTDKQQLSYFSMDRIDDSDNSENPALSFSGLKEKIPDSGGERAEYLSRIRANIEYDCIDEANRTQVDEMIGIMLDVICSNSSVIRANGSEFPKKTVIERFMSLKYEHIDYVLDALKRCSPDIHNIRAYLITTLFNAPVTIDNYYGALAIRDMRIGKI